MNPASAPPAPIPAATVVLLRDCRAEDHAEGIEVLLLRRRGKGFLGGMYVFPGGKLDPVDASAELLARLEAPGSPTAFAQEALGEDETSAEVAAALHIAAIRETLEECGLLLGAGIEPESLVQARATANAGDFQQALAHVEAALGRRLSFPLAAVTPIARWITPTLETKRFDARFFAGRAPARQEETPDGNETDEALWATPTSALERHASGKLPLLPPTWMTLEGLRGMASVDDAMRSLRARRPGRVQPEPARGAGFTLCFPGDHAHSVPDAAIPGPTRLSFDNGVWRPDVNNDAPSAEAD